MPIPNPRQDETHDEFISRCMADDVMSDEYPDEDQRYSICETSWDDRDKENGKMSDNKMLTKALDFAVKDDDADDRTLEFVGSTEAWDRDDEIILSSAWNLETYRKNPVVLFGHNHNVPAIGKATSVHVNREGQLKFKVKFAEMEVHSLADTVYKLYKGGYMKAVSVGLMPLEWEYGKSAEEPYRIITKADLFELSMVNVGANPEALISSRGVMKAMKDGAVDQGEIDELALYLEEILKEMSEEEETKEEKQEERKIEPAPGIKLTMEVLDSEEFVNFLKEHDLEIVAKSMFEKTSVTPQVEEPEPDIYDVLLQDLKASEEPHEKSHEDEDLTDELIALLKSENPQEEE